MSAGEFSLVVELAQARARIAELEAQLVERDDVTPTLADLGEYDDGIMNAEQLSLSERDKLSRMLDNGSLILHPEFTTAIRNRLPVDLERTTTLERAREDRDELNGMAGMPGYFVVKTRHVSPWQVVE